VEATNKETMQFILPVNTECNFTVHCKVKVIDEHVVANCKVKVIDNESNFTVKPYS
jgi:hypothetical protein